MRLKKIQRYLQDNPHLVHDAYQLSMEEAAQIIDAGSPMEFGQLLRKAMQKSSQPAAAWEKVIGNADRQKAKRPFRKLAYAVVSVVLAILLLFPLATNNPTVAEPMTPWVAETSGNTVTVRDGDGSRVFALAEGQLKELYFIEYLAKEYLPLFSQPEHSRTTYSSFADFYNAVGYNPVLLNYTDYTLSSLTHIQYEAGVNCLLGYYHSEIGGFFVSLQCWLADGTAFTAQLPPKSSPLTVLDEHTLQLGSRFYPTLGADMTEGLAADETLIYSLLCEAPISADDLRSALRFYV